MVKQTVAECVADYLSHALGIKMIFSVTGGGAMFLNDAFGKHEKLSVMYNHHEQSSSMAAVGYAKEAEGYGAVCVTTGCGCTNALTGLLDAWQDSVPIIYISGQVKLKDTTKGTTQPLRQLGVQEANIIEIVSSITKYSVMLTSPLEIRYELEKASWIAKSGRSGPVWIDIPQDIQGAPVEWASLKPYVPIEDNPDFSVEQNKLLQDLLDFSERPILLAGNGIRLSNQRQEFREFAERNQIPVVFSYLSIDLLPTDHPLNIGRLGTKGDRAGNFAIQNSDLVIVLGSRLSIPLTGFEYEKFAREAKIVVVDIDEEEHQKRTVSIDLLILADLRSFFQSERLSAPQKIMGWVQICQGWKRKWPVYQEGYGYEEKINMYEFIESLKTSAPQNSIFVSDAGSAYYVTSQALSICEDQRYHTSGAQADMGFTLPASIGVSMASKDRTVIGITGDGSFQMNIQELQTVAHYKPNLKLVIWNNEGYLSIKTTQRKFFNSRFAGTEKSSGISFPDAEKIANAYGIAFFRMSSPEQLRRELKSILFTPGPVIIEIMCPRDQELAPIVSAFKKEDGTMLSKPIEDMYPFLDREEFLREMIVEPVPEQ